MNSFVGFENTRLGDAVNRDDQSFGERWDKATQERARRGPRAWLQSLPAAVRRAWGHGGTNLAAGLAFYAMLSLVPAALVFVAFVGLFGQYPQTVDAIVKLLAEIAPPGVVDYIRGPVESLVLGKGGAKALIGAGLVFTLWSGSGYVGVFVWVAARVWGVTEHRPYWFRLLLRMVVAAAMICTFAVAALFIVLSGPIVHHLAEKPGWHGVLEVWSAARWPIFVACTTFSFCLLFYIGPDIRHRRLSMFLPGAVLSVAVWLIASHAFTWYLASFDSYNRLYGSLGTLIIFMMWLWLLNLALLIGAEFNAELAERHDALVPRGPRKRLADRVRGPIARRPPG